GTHGYSVEYSGDDNYLPIPAVERVQDTVDYHVSLEQSWMTVTPSPNGFGYNIAVQLNDSAGNPIKIDSAFSPLIRLASTRAIPINITSHGNGNYTAPLPVRKAAAETLVITATINGLVFKTVTLTADVPRHRAAHF